MSFPSARLLSPSLASSQRKTERHVEMKEITITSDVSVRYVQPRESDQQIEILEQLDLSARSGAHLIRLRVPVHLFVHRELDRPAARRAYLPAILAAAEEVLRECFDSTPEVVILPVHPPIGGRAVFGERPIEANRASLRAFKNLLCGPLGVPR